MTSENFRNTTIDEPQTQIDPRIPTIVELRANGLTWEQIGQQIQLSPRQIYTIRHSDPYTTYLNEYLYPTALKILETAMNDPQSSDYLKLESVKEIMRMKRATIPKRIESRNLSLSLNLKQTRNNNAWIATLTSDERDAFLALKRAGESRLMDGHNS